VTFPYVAPAPRFRLPGSISLGPVRLAVADLDRSVEWYRGVARLRPLEQADRRAVLAAHGAGEPLVELLEEPGAFPVPRGGRLGLYHFALLLPDRAALGRFVAHLSLVREPVGSSDHQVSEAIYLRDPDGLGLEVYADRPRSAWAASAGSLAMTTLPLDLDSVVSAAGGEPWTGAPSGTRVGHVHLHVGDLPRAERFYHEGLGLDRVLVSYPGAMFLSAGGYHHHLGTNTWARDARPAGSGDARLLEWTIRLPGQPDLEAAVSSLEAVGAAPERDRSGVSVADPWGTRIRLVA
jgi:catechol 2,3-dioxygenase